MFVPSRCQNEAISSFYIDIELVCYKSSRVNLRNDYIYFGHSSIFPSKFEYKCIIDNTKNVEQDWVFSDSFMHQSIGMRCLPQGEVDEADSAQADLSLIFYKM